LPLPLLFCVNGFGGFSDGWFLEVKVLALNFGVTLYLSEYSV
jgi:hypothetical protein